MRNIYIINMDKVAILIPTYNNYQYLESCLRSILSVDFVAGLFHIYVINNGHKNSCDFVGDHPKITVFNMDHNMGWEGALKYGVENTKEEFILFLNDDTNIPQSSSLWLQKLLNFFHRGKIGAVGPSSNVVMGSQNIFVNEINPIKYVNYLVGFCMLVKRSSLLAVGGIDDTLPGGDDIDLSIRFRTAGYRLICDRTTFVYHHGFKTGERVNGTPDKPMGWNSYEFKEKTDFALIRKHGFRKWYETLYTACTDKDSFFEDTEGDYIRKMNISGKVVELGCGARKTVENAIGVDMIPKGESIDSLKGVKSVADIVCDVSKKLPFDNNSVDFIIARHILEHMIDPFETLSYWNSILKTGGSLIIAVPDEDRIRTIPMNFEHKHAFTKDSLKNLLSKLGFVIKQIVDPENGVSFIIEAIKI